MTKRREPLTFHRALTKAAAVIGWDRIAALCGVTERTVRYWSDPDCETEICMIDAERIDRAVLDHGGSVAPFHQVYSLRLGIASHAEAGGSLDPIVMAANAAKESGEAVAAMIAASSAGASSAQKRAACQEIEEAINVLTAALASLGRIPADGQ